MKKNTMDSDILAVIEGGGPKSSIKKSILKLSKSASPDARIIASQACVLENYLSGIEVLEWIKKEKNVEVRCNLYLSCARFNPKSFKSLSKNILNKINLEIELLYLNCSMSIAYSSRVYFIECLKYIFSKNQKISTKAVELCNILIDKNDYFSKKFIEKLQIESQNS